MFKNTIHDGIYYFELFFQIFNHKSDLVFLVEVNDDRGYQYVFLNDAAQKYTGIGPEAIGQPIQKFLPNDVYLRIKEYYDQALESKVPLSYEDQVILPFHCTNPKEKNTFYFETTITPVFDENDEYGHVFARVRDLTAEKLREKELNRMTDRFKLIWNSSADAMYIFDENEHFLDMNPAFERLFGWKKEELILEPLIHIIPNEHRGESQFIIADVQRGESIPSYPTQRVKKSGKKVDILASYAPLYDDEGNWNGGVAIYKDVSDYIEMVHELEKSEEKYRIIAENSNDLIKITDREGKIIYTSPSLLYQFNIQPEDTIGQSLLSYVCPEDVETVLLAMEKMKTTLEPVSFDYRRYNKEGEAIWLYSIGTPVLDKENQIDRMIFISREITERKIYEQNLEFRALHDTLTGVLNRVGFYNYLDKEMRKAYQERTKLAVMMMDLDQFKQVNDTMGHDIGDQLLIGFTERVKNCLPEKAFFARLGGDEFIILLPDIFKEHEAEDLAKQIIHSVRREWEFGSYRFITTISLGIAFYPPYEQDEKVLLKHADIALYKAKETGRNNYQIFTEEKPEL